MPVTLLFLYPLRSGAGRPQVVDDLLEFSRSRKQVAVDQVIEMLKDLRVTGKACRYLRKLKGTMLWELKPATRGGLRGGTRVYLSFGQQGEVLLLNAEVKAVGASSPSVFKLEQAHSMLTAYRSGDRRVAPWRR